MLTLLTCQPEDFDIQKDPLDSTKGPYGETYRGYTKRRAELARAVKTESFLWCVPVDQPIESFDMDKPVEWTVRVAPERVLRFIDTEKWNRCCADEQLPLSSALFLPGSEPSDIETQVIVSYPLELNEILSRRWYEMGRAGMRRMVREEVFT